MCNMSISRREKKVSEEIFEAIMTKNCLKLMLDIKPQIQEAQRAPKKLNIGISYSKFRKSKIKEKKP